MSESDVHCPWWAVDSSHTGGDLHMVLVALSQTGDVQGPDSTTVHQIQWDVCDLVISKAIAAQLEDSNSEVLHTSCHSLGDEQSYHITISCLGHWSHSWGYEGCRLCIVTTHSCFMILDVCICLHIRTTALFHACTLNSDQML